MDFPLQENDADKTSEDERRNLTQASFEITNDMDLIPLTQPASTPIQMCTPPQYLDFTINYPPINVNEKPNVPNKNTKQNDSMEDKNLNLPECSKTKKNPNEKQ